MSSELRADEASRQVVRYVQLWSLRSEHNRTGLRCEFPGHIPDHRKTAGSLSSLPGGVGGTWRYRIPWKASNDQLRFTFA